MTRLLWELEIKRPSPYLSLSTRRSATGYFRCVLFFTGQPCYALLLSPRLSSLRTDATREARSERKFIHILVPGPSTRRGRWRARNCRVRMKVLRRASTAAVAPKAPPTSEDAQHVRDAHVPQAKGTPAVHHPAAPPSLPLRMWRCMPASRHLLTWPVARPRPPGG